MLPSREASGCGMEKKLIRGEHKWNSTFKRDDDIEKFYFVVEHFLSDSHSTSLRLNLKSISKAFIANLKYHDRINIIFHRVTMKCFDIWDEIEHLCKFRRRLKT